MTDNVTPAAIDNTTPNPMAFPSNEKNRKRNCNNPTKIVNGVPLTAAREWLG
tara:strand:- start:155 stop:310 length:156 start_codon:yes stop_codon:yes gene_type:complete